MVSAIGIGIGVAMWCWPSPGVAQVGPTLAAVSATTHSTTTAAAVTPTALAAKLSTPPIRTTPSVPADRTGQTRPGTAAAKNNLHPTPAKPSPAATTTHRTTRLAAGAAGADFVDSSTRAVPASISMAFPSSHHPDGVRMNVLPHGPDSNGDVWIPGPEEGIDDWADDVSWLNTPGFAAPFSSHGAVIIAGHINWGGTWGALSDLAEYGADDIGKDLTVTMTDGRSRTYRITAGFSVDKSRLAAETNQGPLHTAMFGQTQTYGVPGHPSEELRLISCGGDFDSATRNYTSNVVITAQPVS